MFFRRPGDSRVVRALWRDGFLPLVNTRILSWNGVAGWRGDGVNWTYDASLSAGADSIAYRLNNSNNPTLGAHSPREFYAGKQSYGEVVAAIDFSRPLSIGLTKQANLGLGLEYRREAF